MLFLGLNWGLEVPIVWWIEVGFWKLGNFISIEVVCSIILVVVVKMFQFGQKVRIWNKFTDFELGKSFDIGKYIPGELYFISY